MLLERTQVLGLLLIAALALLAPGAASAGTVYVDAASTSEEPDGSQSDPFPAIQSGINNANFHGHSRVEVAAGLYHESIMMADGVDVIGAGADVTIIDGSDRGQSTVLFIDTENNPRFSGFTISGGSGRQVAFIQGVPVTVGGGIFIWDSAPTISDNIITGNAVTDGVCRGGGIYANAVLEGPTIRGNVISNNVALSDEATGEDMGGGIYVVSKLSSAVIAENIIEFNQAELGGGIYSINITESTVSIARNTLAYNQAREGAALQTQDYENSTTTIVNNLIYGNSSTAGLIDCDDGESLSSPGQSELCNDSIDNDCNPSTPDIFDGDGDGSMCNLDCADGDPTISHLAGEHCRDGIDNDCDGSIDLVDPENVVLLEEGSSMLYLANSLSPGILLDWVAVEFDDSGWDAGLYGIGYETDTDGAQDLIATAVGSDTISAYSRATFNITGVSSVNTLWLGADYDDGYVAWINGTEVYRSSEMPAGDPAWNAFPSTHESSNGSSPDYGVLVDISSDGIPVLVEGANVLAIGIYNDAGGSPDLVLAPRLSMSWGTDDLDCLCADADSDGYGIVDCDTDGNGDDCDDTDPSINPGEAEICNDSIDNDCSIATTDVFDGDGDGYNCAVDCSDWEANINPGEAEIVCDGLDNDCNPGTPDIVDDDSDFFDCTVDCNDANPAVKPGALEYCYDGVDNNCDGYIDDADLECSCALPVDGDGDTYRCLDCNDGDPDINPGENELCNDGIDNDCNPNTPDIFDGDHDGHQCDVDCQDFDAAINSGAYEVCNDGIDNDCDGDSDGIDSDCFCADADSDGYACSDCNDGNAAINPGMPEICDDGIDNDCDTDGTPDLYDNDSDGVDCATDCDDNNASTNPNAPEICNDDYDNDCDGLIDILDPERLLVQFGSSMRYLANYSDPGVGVTWVAESYNDLAWSNGLYGVGYQVGPPGTGADDLITTDVADGAASVYTRARFTIPILDGVNAIWLGADYDDGYVAWLNGVEIYRSPEMPAGPPTWDANPELHESSNGQVPDYGALLDISSDGIPLLNEGENVLAIGLYNDIPSGTYSSDLVVVPKLVISYGSDDPECLCDDNDGDGYTTSAVCGTDCNDADAEVNPGISEIGCDLTDNDCDAGTPDILDGDSDGYSCDTDCSDNDPNVNPGAPEVVCDFTDNDCTTVTPDVIDGDSDGYTCYDECDDSDAAINPGAPEVYCDGIDNDCDTLTADVYDQDGDGHKCDVDCNDADAAISPEAFEHCFDEIDNDCDGDSDGLDLADCDCDDLDSDGYACLDCNDANPAINPGSLEICNDGLDNDCDTDGTPDVFDMDADGFDCLADCDDSDAFIRPNALELCGDTVDNDCDPVTIDLFDTDSDGYACDVDCNNFDSAIHPGAGEICDDGIDNDCDPLTQDVFDGDSDGSDCTFDCADDNAAVYPGAGEICDDGIDNDCNVATADRFDADSDGFTCEADCNDSDPAINPAAAEHCDDGIDNDCDADSDGADAECACDDLDSDGYSTSTVCGTDCNDSNPAINPGAGEICNDGIDNDCQAGTTDIADLDGDGYACTLDCDDGNAAVNPGAVEICNDSTDNDCNGGTPDLWDDDSDGHDCFVDCDDSAFDINPSVAEIGCDGLDNDCSSATTDLRDGDSDDYACADSDVRGAGISAIAGVGGITYIVNNTVVGNSLTLGTGGGIWIDDMFASSPSLVANNIVADNSALVGGGIDHTGFFGDLRYNVVHNNFPEDLYDAGGSGAVKTGNLFIDPVLASSSTGNYRLDRHSPLIDAADPAFAPQSDYDRFYRPYDGDRDSDAIADIGAFEYPSGEVFDFVFTDTDAMSWEVLPADETYNLYRGALSILKGNGTYTQPPFLPIPELFCEILPEMLPYVDGYTPAANVGVIYMVTTATTAYEGSLGQASSGRLRPNDNPCP